MVTWPKTIQYKTTKITTLMTTTNYRNNTNNRNKTNNRNNINSRNNNKNNNNNRNNNAYKDGGVILVNFGESFGGLGAVMGGLQSS